MSLRTPLKRLSSWMWHFIVKLDITQGPLKWHNCDIGHNSTNYLSSSPANLHTTILLIVMTLYHKGEWRFVRSSWIDYLPQLSRLFKGSKVALYSLTLQLLQADLTAHQLLVAFLLSQLEADCVPASHPFQGTFPMSKNLPPIFPCQEVTPLPTLFQGQCLPFPITLGALCPLFTLILHVKKSVCTHSFTLFPHPLLSCPSFSSPCHGSMYTMILSCPCGSVDHPPSSWFPFPLLGISFLCEIKKDVNILNSLTK